jgi:hypothetical protein
MLFNLKRNKHKSGLPYNEYKSVFKIPLRHHSPLVVDEDLRSVI